ncbi:hypothetical protein JCM6882_000571 [Rhodosporidiobolus microsporus]
MVTVTIDLDAGTAEPTDAPRRSGRVRTQTFEPKPPSSPLDPHPLFDHPDLLPHLLVNPILKEEDLRALALVNRRLRGAVRDQLFRSISLLSPGCALRFSTLIIEDPTLLHHVRDAEVALADYSSTIVEARRLMGIAEPVVRGSFDSVVAVSSEDQKKKAEAARAAKIAARQAVQRWPFVEGRDAAFPDLLSSVFHSVVTLTLAAPLSHYLESIVPLLHRSTTLTALRLTGHVHGTSAHFGPAMDTKLPTPMAVVRPGHRGLLGGPSTVRDLEVEKMVLVLPDYEVVDSARKSWSLSVLSLQDVTITQPASSPPTLHSPDVSGNPRAAVNPALGDLAQLDLPRLCGGYGPPRLTSLSLIDVDGLSLSSINFVIRESGSVLRHLTLHNVGFETSTFRPLANSAQALGRRDREPVLAHVFAEHGPQTSGAFLCSLQELASAASRFPPIEVLTKSLSGTPLSTSFADALSACNSLFSLRLTATANTVSPTSPFPPSLLNVLLSAAPPLQSLEWDVAVEGPKTDRRWLSEDDWTVFAEGIEEAGEWSTLKKCKVVAKVWEWEARTEPAA